MKSNVSFAKFARSGKGDTIEILYTVGGVLRKRALRIVDLGNGYSHVFCVCNALPYLRPFDLMLGTFENQDDEKYVYAIAEALSRKEGLLKKLLQS